MPARSASEGNPSTVVVIGPDYPDSFADNIASAFRTSGVSATVVSPYAVFARSGGMGEYSLLGRNVRRLLTRVPPLEMRLMDKPVDAALRRANPRLVISVYGYFPPELIERWRVGTPRASWVMWYPDAMVNLRDHRTFLAPWDHLFFKEPILVDVLRARTNLPASLLPQGCNPLHHRSAEAATDQEREKYTCDVVVAGNLYTYRLLVLEQLPINVNLHVHGAVGTVPPRFSPIAASHTGEFVSGRTKALAFQGATVVLNTMHFGEVLGVNSRLFEATACGGFVLTHSSPDMNRYFDAGAEVATFDSGNDLREALHYYLDGSNEEERRAIAAAGQRRAHDEHTYHHRLRELLTLTRLTSDPELMTVLA